MDKVEEAASILTGIADEISFTPPEIESDSGKGEFQQDGTKSFIRDVLIPVIHIKPDLISVPALDFERRVTVCGSL